MTSAEPDLSSTWSKQNQAYLIAEFAGLRQRFSGNEQTDAQTPEPGMRAADLRSRMQPPPAIDLLASLFGLTAFEQQLLLFCAGVEMDSRLAERCAEMQGNPQRTYVTFGLAMGRLEDSNWSALTPTRPLRRFRMLEVQSGNNLTAAPLRIDERILHYLAGINVLDPRLESVLRLAPFPEWIAEEHRTLSLRAASLIEAHAQYAPLIHLCGDDPQGQEDIAAFAAHEIGRQLFVAKTEELPAMGPDLDQFAFLWERESLLTSGALLIQAAYSGLPPSASHVVERLPGLIFVASREPVRVDRTVVRLDVNKPGPVGQKQLWSKALGESAENFEGMLDDLAEQFRLSARMIASTGYLLGSSP
jgi:hypothetical protein